MRERIKFWLISLLVLSLFLSACTFGQEPEPTPDVGVIFTAAAETVQAQFSESRVVITCCDQREWKNFIRNPDLRQFHPE